MAQQPWWQDPLNKVMGMVPEPLQRGAQAVGRGMDALTPENPPVADPGYPNIWEEQVAGRLPEGFREFAEFFGNYASLAGFDPGGASGKAMIGPFLTKGAKLAPPGASKVPGMKQAMSRDDDILERAMAGSVQRAEGQIGTPGQKVMSRVMERQEVPVHTKIGERGSAYRKTGEIAVDPAQHR